MCAGTMILIFVLLREYPVMMMKRVYTLRFRYCSETSTELTPCMVIEKHPRDLSMYLYIGNTVMAATNIK